MPGDADWEGAAGFVGRGSCAERETQVVPGCMSGCLMDVRHVSSPVCVQINTESHWGWGSKLPDSKGMGNRGELQVVGRNLLRFPPGFWSFFSREIESMDFFFPLCF